MSVYSNSVVKGRKRKLGFNIIVDTREQKPLWSGLECNKLCLLVGDYTTDRLNNKFIVERKSPGDLYGTITRGHPRFKREIKRAIENNIQLVVFVETDRLSFINKKWPGGAKRLYPSTGLDRIISTLIQRYDLEFIWCKNRLDMKKKIIRRLKIEEKLLTTS